MPRIASMSLSSLLSLSFLIALTRCSTAQTAIGEIIIEGSGMEDITAGAASPQPPVQLLSRPPAAAEASEAEEDAMLEAELRKAAAAGANISADLFPSSKKATPSPGT